MGNEREAVIAREITKAHETIYRGTLAQLIERAQSEANLARGEITLVVHGAAEAEKRGESLQLERVVALLAKELPPGRAASLAAQITGAKRSDAYALISRDPADRDEV
jgi:16S rRNA (cytidine1402-2'-O)-methyltransferase